MLPTDALLIILFLLQLEDVSNEKLLQILIRIIDAKLLETRKQIAIKLMSFSSGINTVSKIYLLTWKFSKPKISRTPIELVVTELDLWIAQFNLLTIHINNRP